MGASFAGSGKLTLWGQTNVGKSRERNEDYFVTTRCELSRTPKLPSTTDDSSQSTPPSVAHLLAVADGLGGHSAGEVASRKAINALCKSFRPVEGDAIPLTLETVRDRLEDAVEFANEEVIRAGNIRADRRGMATTLTAVVVCEGAGWIAHCGDTRCYQLRESGLQQLTRDHTLGAISKTTKTVAGVPHPTDHVLWNCLGGKRQSGLRIDFGEFRLATGDHLLLCSDGLTLHVRDDDIKFVLESSSSPEMACRELIAVANLRGGHDNITAIVGRWESNDSWVDKARSASRDESIDRRGTVST